MSTLGVITTYKKLEHEYLNSIINQAVEAGISVYLFTPENIDLDTLMAAGKKFDSISNSWISEPSFLLPTYLYIFSPAYQIEKYLPIFKKIKEENFTFLNYPLPNRYILYNVLKTNTLLGPYLPKTKKADHPNIVIDALRDGKSHLLKPVISTKGKGIFILTQTENDHIQIKTSKNQKIIEKNFPLNKFQNWLFYLLNQKSYILQPYITNFNEDNQLFDLHFLFQKDIFGQWKEQARGIRISKSNSILTSEGGVPTKWRDDQLSKFTSLEIDEITNIIPSVLETIFHPIFEVSIELTVDESGALWLLDVNSDVDHHFYINSAPEIAENIYQSPISYIQHRIALERKE